MENNLRQHQIIATLCEKAQQAINEAYHTIEYDCDGYENGDEIIITHETPCGVIELYCEINEPWEVYIDNTTAHKLPNLHEALREALPPYEFDFEQAREELARSSYELSCQEYEMSSTGYFL